MIEQNTAARVLSRLVNVSGSPETSSLGDLRSPFTSRVTNLLIRSPLLPRLAQLQSTLDALDIEGLDEYWKRYHRSVQNNRHDTTIPPLGHHEPEPTLEEWGDFITTYLEQCAHDSKTRLLDDLAITKEELRYHILAYLMSATFKDCSIILRLSSSSSSLPDPPIEETITAIDLDPKSVRRLEKWRQLDRDIAATYSKYLATRSNAP